jgi:hypothetical protein
VIGGHHSIGVPRSALTWSHDCERSGWIPAAWNVQWLLQPASVQPYDPVCARGRGTRPGVARQMLTAPARLAASIDDEILARVRYFQPGEALQAQPVASAAVDKHHQNRLATVAPKHGSRR